ncbi:MAG TPA: hypothetical protein VIG74_04310 [Alphaproteobacteria bacterium]|jgi:hypothetical protein
MSQIDDILESKKINAYLIVKLMDSEESLTKQFRIAISATTPLTVKEDHLLTPEGQTVEGVSIQSDIAGKIYLATATLEGLERLVKDDRVSFISASPKAQPI